MNAVTLNGVVLAHLNERPRSLRDGERNPRFLRVLELGRRVSAFASVTGDAPTACFGLNDDNVARALIAHGRGNLQIC